MSDRGRTARNISIIGVGIIIISLIILVIQGIYFGFYKSNFEYEIYNILSLGFTVSILIGVILILIGLVVFIIYRTERDKPKENAKNILYERYAKGEITKKEFEDMKKDLE